MSNQKHQHSQNHSHASEYAAQAVRYIEEHFHERIYVSELAADIGISRSYLSQLVKDAIGLSPQEYLVRCRMERAAELLRGTRDPIRYVAFSCGYEDSLAFSKAFRKYYGKSPSEYRDDIFP